MSELPLRELPSRVLPVTEQAAYWLFELAERPADEALRRAFLAWLKSSPRHIEEFLAMAALEQEFPRRTGDVEAILAEARRSAATLGLGGEVPVEQRRAARPPARSLWQYGWASAAAAAAGLVLFVVLGGDRPVPPVLHVTDFGEQRAVSLPDGSTVTLNTRSTLSVRFDGSARRVYLLQGQAMFDVAGDEDKPFIVETGDVALSVLGTKFSVYRKVDAVEVVVVEGTVAATSRRMPGRPVLVNAGEGAVATLEGAIHRSPLVDVERALAWTERRLVFDDAALAEVVSEFNRYNRVPLVVEDAELARRRITTVFNAHDSRALVGFLELEPDIEVEHGSDAIRVRVRR